MRRVTAVGQYGNVVMDEVATEGKEITHNEMLYNMFEELLKPLQGEKVEGDLISIWPNAGLITKYLDMMVYLETTYDDAIVNHPVCIIPQTVSESQLNYYDENYLHSIDTFIPIYYNGEEFKLLGDSYLDSYELQNIIKSKLASKKFTA